MCVPISAGFAARQTHRPPHRSYPFIRRAVGLPARKQTHAEAKSIYGATCKSGSRYSTIVQSVIHPVIVSAAASTALISRRALFVLDKRACFVSRTWRNTRCSLQYILLKRTMCRFSRSTCVVGTLSQRVLFQIVHERNP